MLRFFEPQKKELKNGNESVKQTKSDLYLDTVKVSVTENYRDETIMLNTILRATSKNTYSFAH